ncbi:MAG: hypothetical protein IKH78_11005 [Ruminococcus sp.]|nr:hypothetical protein [Ruminococcus sp.]
MSSRTKKDLIFTCVMTAVFFVLVAKAKAPFFLYPAVAAMCFGLFGLNYILERSSDRSLNKRMDKQFQDQSLEYDKFRQDFTYDYPVKDDLISDLRYRYTHNPLAISFSSPVKKFEKAYASQLEDIERAYMNGRMITAFLCGVNISREYVVMYDQHSIKAIPADRIVSAQIRCTRLKTSDNGIYSGDVLHYYFAVLTEGSSNYDMVMLGSMKSRIAYDELFRAGILRKNEGEQCPQLYDYGKLSDIDPNKLN